VNLYTLDILENNQTKILELLLYLSRDEMKRRTLSGDALETLSIVPLIIGTTSESIDTSTTTTNLFTPMTPPRRLQPSKSTGDKSPKAKLISQEFLMDEKQRSFSMSSPNSEDRRKISVIGSNSPIGKIKFLKEERMMNDRLLSPISSEYIQLEPLVTPSDMKNIPIGPILINEVEDKIENGPFIKPEIIEDYFQIPNKSKEEAIEALVTSKRKMQIKHTQHDSMVVVKKSESFKKKQRTSCSFQFIALNQQLAPIDEILLKEFEKKEDKFLKDIRTSFSNNSLFSPMIINIQSEKGSNENLKILFKCLSHPRVLYKKLPENESNFLLKYKYFLIFERKIFVKMMKAIRWDLEKERKEILYLIENPKVEDLLTMEEILELLCFKQKELRDLALKCLRKLPVEQIELVLLQLVQTIRFEDYNQIKFKTSTLLNLLLDLSKQSFHIASKLNWYLSIEREAEKDKTFFANLFSNSLYHLGDTLSKSEEGKQYLKMILKQQKIVDQLTSISNYFNTELASKDRLFKEKVLNDIIEGTHQHSNIDLVSIFKEETLIYLPLNTHFGIDDIKVDSGRIFKSALQPISVTFTSGTSGGGGGGDNPFVKSEMSVIFKKGDDLRQDVLITQMIKFMNDCLSCNNLELCLSPYHVLATGIDTGFVEIVPNSTTVGSILKQFGTIQEYFKKSDSDGILRQETIKTYVKSCAGYCIITYILGIGDRHLE
jgi:hypothetical protein